MEAGSRLAAGVFFTGGAERVDASLSVLAIYYNLKAQARPIPGCGTARPGTRLRPSHTVSRKTHSDIGRASEAALLSSLQPLDSKQLFPTVLCSCVLLDCVRSGQAAGSTNHGSACRD